MATNLSAVDYSTEVFIRDILSHIHCFFLVVTILVSVYFVSRVYNVGVIHINFRIILCNMPVCCTLLNIARLSMFAWESNSHYSMTPQMSNSICLGIRIVEEICMGFLAVLATQLAVERFVGTVLRKTYEKSGAMIGISITIQTFIFAVVFALSPVIYDMYITGAFRMDEHHESCRLDVLHLHFYFIVWVAAFISGIGAAKLLYLILRYNKRKYEESLRMGLQISSAAFDLSTRYQFQENIHVLQTLLPAVIIYLCTASIGILCVIRIEWKFEEMNRVTIDAYLHFMRLVVQFYCIATAWVFLTRFPALRRRFRSDISSILSVWGKRPICEIGSTTSARSSAYAPTNSTDAHFGALVSAWDHVFETETERKSSKCRGAKVWPNGAKRMAE